MIRQRPANVCVEWESRTHIHRKSANDKRLSGHSIEMWNVFGEMLFAIPTDSKSPTEYKLNQTKQEKKPNGLRVLNHEWENKTIYLNMGSIKS